MLCPYCNREFTRSNNLNKHIRNKHPLKEEHLRMQTTLSGRLVMTNNKATQTEQSKSGCLECEQSYMLKRMKRDKREEMEKITDTNAEEKLAATRNAIKQTKKEFSERWWKKLHENSNA